MSLTMPCSATPPTSCLRNMRVMGDVSAGLLCTSKRALLPRHPTTAENPKPKEEPTNPKQGKGFGVASGEGMLSPSGDVCI
eukprot:5988707-Pyramimonas_sp.AAC.1